MWLATNPAPSGTTPHPQGTGGAASGITHHAYDMRGPAAQVERGREKNELYLCVGVLGVGACHCACHVMRLRGRVRADRPVWTHLTRTDLSPPPLYHGAARRGGATWGWQSAWSLSPPLGSQSSIPSCTAEPCKGGKDTTLENWFH